MGTLTKSLSLKDQVSFQCRLCGDCCRGLEGQLMLEPPDAYRLGRHLRASGAVAEIEDVYAKYAHVSMLAEGIPIFLMNTVGADHACVFLKERRCTIYRARPRVCRLYPFSAFPGGSGEKFRYAQCVDSNAAHFSAGTVCVQDWMWRNFSNEDRAFLEKEAGYTAELGRLLRGASSEKRREWLFPLLLYRYYNYDLERPFPEQYERNHRELLDHLRQNGRKER